MWNNFIELIVTTDSRWYNTNKGNEKTERDDLMAITKEHKLQATSPNKNSTHKEIVRKAIKEITSQHTKLLKKLAE